MSVWYMWWLCAHWQLCASARCHAFAFTGNGINANMADNLPMRLLVLVAQTNAAKEARNKKWLRTSNHFSGVRRYHGDGEQQKAQKLTEKSLGKYMNYTHGSLHAATICIARCARFKLELCIVIAMRHIYIFTYVR